MNVKYLAIKANGGGGDNAKEVREVLTYIQYEGFDRCLKSNQLNQPLTTSGGEG
jgi:hypothetical protein